MPGVLHCTTRSVFVLFRVLIQEGSITRKRKKQIEFYKSPPPQTKTLKTRKVLLYRAALLFQTWEGDTKLCYEFKFSYIGRTAVKTFARDLVFYDIRRFLASVYLCKS